MPISQVSSYCALCDIHFESAETRDIHVRNTELHPLCVPCNIRYYNGHTLRMHQCFYCPHHQAPAGFIKRQFNEGDICVYDECDWDFEPSDDEDFDTDSVVGNSHIGPLEKSMQASEPIKIPEALSVRDRIIQLQQHAVQPLLTSDSNKPRRQPSCGICHKPTKNTTATRCGHLFCQACIDKKIEKERACPVCGSPAVKRQLRKIFLVI